MAWAQEVADSTAAVSSPAVTADSTAAVSDANDSVAVDTTRQQGSSNRLRPQVDPWQWRLQGRYLPQGNGFPTRVIDRMSIGIFYGWQRVKHRGNKDLSDGHPFGALLKYDASPLHTFRLLYSHSNYKLTLVSSNVKHDEVAVGYQANISNMVAGYNPRRIANTGVFMEVGTIFGDFGVTKKTNLTATLGLSQTFNLGGGIDLFAEPFVSLMSDQIDLSQETNAHRWDVMWGVRGGLALSPTRLKAKSRTLRDNTTLWFSEFAAGPSVMWGEYNDVWRSLGMDLLVNIGRWISPGVAIRIGGAFGRNVWRTEAYDARTAYGIVISPQYDRVMMQYCTTGRAELVADLLGGLKGRRDKWGRLGLNVSGGAELSYMMRTVNKSTAGDNQMRKSSFGGTAALQLLYAPPKSDMSLFIEPRVSLHHYTSAFVNTVYQRASFTDYYASLNVGVRMPLGTTPDQRRTADEGEDMEERGTDGMRFRVGATGGLGYISLAEDLRVNSGVDWQAALHAICQFNPVHALHLQVGLNQYSYCDKENYWVDPNKYYETPELWNSRFGLLMTDLTYMLSLNRLFNPHKKTPFSAGIEAGPCAYYCLYHNHSLAPGVMAGGENPRPVDEGVKGKFSAGVTASLFASYDITPHFSLFFQPGLHMMFKDLLANLHVVLVKRTEMTFHVNLGATYNF